MDNHEQKEGKIEIIDKPEIKKVEKPTPRVVNFIKIGTLNIYNQAVKEPFSKRYERFYRSNRKHLWLDLFFVLIILFLIGFNLFIAYGPATRFSMQLGNLPLIKIEKENLQPKLNFEINQFLISQPQTIVNLNEELNLKISCRNLSEQNINNFKLITEIKNAKQYKITSGNLEKEIATLASSETAENFIKIKIVETDNNLIKIQSQALININGQEKIFYSEPLYLKINTELKLNSFARYFTAEGDQLGVGPLPPQVGESTSYWIFWQVESSLNNLNEVEISGVLPANVYYSGKFSVNYGQGLEYNQTTRKISWQVGELEKGKVIQAGMEITIIPTLEQKGTAAVLMNQILATSQDSFTGQKLEKTNNNITTNLVNDLLAQDKGNVE